jgi:hypothetical protein
MIAVPWMEDAVPYERLLGEIIQTFGGRFTSELIEPMSDRKDTTVLCRKRLARDNGSYIDISVVDPRVPKLPRVRG